MSLELIYMLLNGSEIPVDGIVVVRSQKQQGNNREIAEMVEKIHKTGKQVQEN